MATTINAANVSIGFDAKKLREGGQFTRSEIANIRKTMQDAVPMTERLAGSINALERAFQAGAIDADKYSRAMDHLKTKLREANLEASKTKTGFTSMGSQLTVVAGRFFALTAAIGVAKKTIGMSMEAEQTKIALEVLTGSASVAEDLSQSFRKLDRESPLSFIAFQEASKTMMQFGVQAKQLNPILDSMSKLSLGNEQRLHSMALAFGQVTAAGRLTGQEVLQFVNAGFNPLQQIAKDTGKSMGDLRKEMEAGAISVRMVEEAFLNATKEGTNFFDMNDRLSKTAAGQFAKMKTDVSILARSIGNEFLPALKEMIQALKGSDEAGGAITGFARSLSDGLRFGTALAQDVVASVAANGKPIDRSALEELTKNMIDEDESRVRAKLESEYKIMNRVAKPVAIEPIIEKLTEPIFETLSKTMRTASQKLSTPLEVIDQLEKNAEKMLSIQERRDERLTDLQKNFDDWLKESGERSSLSPNMAPAIKAGTQEAFKFLQDREKAKEDRQLEIARQQKKLQESQLKVQQDTLKEIKKLPKIRSAG